MKKLLTIILISSRPLATQAESSDSRQAIQIPQKVR
jgi:hypothetical protein